MVGLYKNSSGIQTLNYFYKKDGVVKNENDLRMFRRVNGEILELPKNGLLVNVDYLTFSQNKVVNTCLNKPLSFYKSSQNLGSFGEVRTEHLANSVYVDGTNKCLRVANIGAHYFRAPNIFTTQAMTIYLTARHYSEPVDTMELFCLYNSKFPRIKWNEGSYKFAVSNSVGVYDPYKYYGKSRTIDRFQWFNFTITIHGGKYFNCYQNGVRFGNANLAFTGGLDRNLTDVYIGSSTLDMAIRTLRIYNRAISTDEMNLLLKFDEINTANALEV